MKLVADRDELCESDLPRLETKSPACVSEENSQIRIRKVTVKLAQFFVDEVDSDLFTVTFPSVRLITTQLLCQQFTKHRLPIFGGIKIHDYVSFVAVSVRKFNASIGCFLIVWTPDDVLAVAFVYVMFNGFVE